MPVTRGNESQAEMARRGVLGHIQHLKSFGEAITKAADTYLTGHKASEAASDWRDNLPQNLADANREFHRTLAAEAKTVADVYFGDTEPTVDKPATKKGGEK